ncbi:hypothetical protein ST47_g2723 [Ascochyta rabiei]|uniref:Uncharacterized protein n=1 Tax=Didymella rabiei TaxID=5454 RepID=A0A163J3V5_DIDRA|nr:hypothetical protein ST47_g2723 [Ascochyta rabiei]
MAELSKGKQYATNHRPSGLRHVQQVPDSDFEVPETQLEASQPDSIDILPDDADFLACNQVKRSSHHILLPQTFGVDKPSSATIVEPAFSFEPIKRALNKTPPQQNAPALQPSTHPDAAVLSIEHDNSGPHKPVSTSPPPAIEEDAAIVASEKEEAPLVQDQIPKPSHTIPTLVEIGDTGHTRHPPSKPVSIAKATRNGRKARKGRKTLVSGLLVSYPNPIAESSKNPTSLEHKVEAGGPIQDVGDWAVKPQDSGVRVPTDGPSDTKAQSLLIAEKRLRRFTMDNASTSVQHQVKDSAHTSSIGATQQSVFSGPKLPEPTNIAGRSTFSEVPSSNALYEGHAFSLKMQQNQDGDAGIQGGLSFVGKPMTQHPGTNSTLRQVLGPTSSGKPSGANQQISPYSLTTELDQAQASFSCLQDVHTGLHEPSSRMGPIRVTKPHKKVRPLHNSYSRPSLAGSNSQTTAKTTALEIALDSFRTACLVDQSRMEDQMSFTLNTLKQEKRQLEKELWEQQTANNELSLQQKIQKESLARLTEKAKTLQKYVSGLQDDHERCQRLVVVSQKRNSQALQDTIAETVREKADLQRAFDQAVDSFRKSQTKMTKTLNETYVQHEAAISRITDLEEHLTELTSTYEAEKARSTEIEKQLVPSLQSIQRQLSESTVAFTDKLSSMDAKLACLASEDRNQSGVMDCLHILQKLKSISFLTVDEARKAEGMLRFIYERTDAGFEQLAETFASEPRFVESIRQCVRDQVQGLLAEILRRGQAIVECHPAPHATGLIKSELDTLKQTHQQTEAQVNLLTQSEAALKSHSVQLETQRNELQATLQEHQAQARLEIEQLQGECNRTKSDLLLANDTIKQAERLYLGREREFFEYRSQALAHCNSHEKQIQQMKTQLQAGNRANDTLQEDLTSSKAMLESVQSDYDQLSIDVSHYKSIADTLRQEGDHLEKEHETTQASLRSTEERFRVLEADREVLTGTLREVRTSLRKSIDAGAGSNTKCSDLRQQLGDLQDAKNASDEQLQKAQRNHAMELQQIKQDCVTRIEDLRSRLAASEDDRKDSHAKVRLMEAAHKQQLECHKQETSARFEQLGSESERTRKELEVQQQKANAEIDELQRQVNEWKAKTAIKVLVPNSQPSLAHNATSNALQQPQSGKTRKKVDRQTNSVTVVPSSSRRPDTDERRPIIDRYNLLHNRREGSQHQTGFFEEEYDNRFGPQITFHEQENNLPLTDAGAQMVPETQEIELAQGSTAQFAVIESQVSVSGGKNREKTGSDLSTMPSEDLSEMLLDLRSDPGRRRDSSGYLPSPKNTICTPERSGQEITSDPPSSTSQDRPKSRANTASRMAPLPVHDAPRQRVHADDLAQNLAYVHPHRSLNNVGPKRDHAQLVSVYAGTQPSGADAGQKRKSASDIEQGAPSKRTRVFAQPIGHRPSPISKSDAPFTPAPTSTTSHPDVNPSPSNATGRHSSNRSSSNAGSQSSAPRLSSTRNTRSKTNKYADRFGQELDRH